MKTPLEQNEKRGSALLIVLGLLGFLMISAVAFSITMRTEYKAAAAYRQSVIARDLVATAFAEAQYAVELSMEKSAKDMATLQRSEKRRRDYLCPFKSSDSDEYGRLISSSNGSSASVENHGDMAYLLDERAMRHVPPYVAYDVLNILEFGGNSTALDVLSSRDDDVYTINDYARWRPITVKRPKVDVSKITNSNRVEDVDEVIIGRMAWSVINLSDTLDINGIGSASTVRGLGLTGSEFAYIGGEVGADGLFKTDVDFGNLPLFYTNADISQYAALSRDSGSFFIANGDNHPIYSWIFAASDRGEDHRIDAEAKSILAPFSVYSFWPDPERGQRHASRNRTYPANAITEEAINSGAAEDYFDESLFRDFGASGQSSSVYLNFLRMLGDYIDKDKTPTYDGIVNDYLNHSLPSAENTPMVNEVAYDAANSLSEQDIESVIDKDLVETIEGLASIPGNTSAEDWQAFKTLGEAGLDEEIELTFEKLALDVALGAYYPASTADTSDTYDLYPEGFIGLSARAYINDAEKESIISREKAIAATEMKDASGVAVAADGNVFTKGSYETLEPKNATDLVITLNPRDIPVRLPETVDNSARDQNIKIRCLVDFFFRAKIEGNEIVDRVPVSNARSTSSPSVEDAKDIKTMLDLAYTGRRNDKSTMGVLDSQFFRVTKAFEITFSVRWVQEGTGKNAKYICKVYGEDGKGAPSVEILSNETSFGRETLRSVNDTGAATASPLCIFPDKGCWSTIDPRYNWISPMYGCSDAATPYVGSNVTINSSLSSPHWLFVPNADLTADGTTPSEVQIAYEENHLDIVPFSWGLKIEDIRYNTNNTGSLLMPSEIAFLPVPKATNVWHSEVATLSYLQHSIADYYNNVGQDSFFRTIPIVDLGDGVISGTEQTAYNELINSLSGFTGIPEEHRSIMSVYAGQDNYILGQRLRRLAMKGLPASIKDAVAVSSTRIDEAANAGRISDEFATGMRALKDASTQAPTEACSKYTTFINDYLFPIPDDNNDDIDWATGASLTDATDVDSLRATRPQNALDPLGIFGEDVTGITSSDAIDESYFADIIKLYNEQAKTPSTTGNANEDNCKLGQNDITNLVAFSRECFGDRQQLFLYIMRVDTTASASKDRLHEATPTSTTRAIALVWRDAYGEIPSRVVYFTTL